MSEIRNAYGRRLPIWQGGVEETDLSHGRVVWVQEIYLNGDLVKVAVFSSWEAADKWSDQYMAAYEPDDPYAEVWNFEVHAYQEVIDAPEMLEECCGSA